MADDYFENKPWYSYHTDITTVVIAYGVTSIGIQAFNGCTSLTSITIPASVTSIGHDAFSGCTSLTSIELCAGLTRIDYYAFMGCTGLTSIEIPASVTTIGEEALKNCTSLNSVTIYAPSLTSYGNNAFASNASGRKIYVFKNCVDTYKSGWSDYASDIQAIEDISLQDNDDNSALIAAANDNALGALNVTLQGRTLYKDGAWNTLCLPFDVTAAQMAETTHPLYGATIKEMDNTAEGTSLDNGTLTLKFNTASSIVAGKPYIVKWETTGVSVSDPVFSGVTISDTTPTAIVSNDNHVTFVGQYSPFTIDDSNINSVIMLGAKNTLGYSKNPRQLHSFRAHFEIPTHTGAPAMNSYVIDFGDESTGISLTPDPSPRGEGSEYYTLDGRKLDGKPTKKGMYIVNGKKVVVK